MKTNVTACLETLDLSSWLRNSSFGFRAFSRALAVLFLAGVCFADEQAAEDQQSTQIKAAQKWLHDYYQQQAATYEFYFDEAKTQRLEFVDKSIFHWKQDNDWSGGLFVRLLPQPIYRYAAPDAGVIDGGLFAYVWTRGTDPETLLLLECRDEAPKPRWYYSLLRFTTRPLQVKMNDREVWNSPGVGNSIRGDSQEPYVTFNAGFVSVPADQP